MYASFGGDTLPYFTILEVYHCQLELELTECTGFSSDDVRMLYAHIATKFDYGDKEVTKALILQNLREIGVRASAWQEATRDEIARILDEGLQTWDDVAETTVEFKDKGWGSEALGGYALASMIPNGSRVIVESASGQKMIADESNRSTIARNIDDSVVQKYVAGSDVVFII